MNQKFQNYITNNNLIQQSDKVLLAVSGGKDSVFMINLFLEAKLNFGIAHCNFKLRGNEADIDEQFVKQIADKNNIPFHSTFFNTQEYSKSKGISIQMAARELRYTWFEKVREESNYSYTSTAHHKNDVAETMLINLIKGTGLAGLHGIRNKKDKIIRPLLCFTREEIDSYILSNQIDYREDKSNSDTKYIRNKIRHHILPEFYKINPSIIETLNNEAEQFSELEMIIEDKIVDEKKRLFVYDKLSIRIKIEELNRLKPLDTYLYYLLKDYGFNKSSISNIIESFKGNSGKIFYSKTHQLIKDRKFLILKEITEKEINSFIIEKITDFDLLPININYKVKHKEEIVLLKSKEFAYLDYSKLDFPIILRKWRKGDIFQPFGMKGKKKISDYFIDNKIAIPDKESAWILEYNNKIIWLLGERIDDNYKINSQSQLILVLQLLD